MAEVVTHPRAAAYSRETLLAWVRANAPDLRILHGTTADGKPACAARFTFFGEVVELEAIGPECSTAIATLCADAMRRALGLPRLQGQATRLHLERQILRAALAGDNAEAERRSRDWVRARAQDPAPWGARVHWPSR